MGLDQAVKPGCSHPGQGMPAAQAKSAGLSDPKPPVHPVHWPRASDWQGAGPLMAYQESAPQPSPSHAQGVSTASSCQLDTNVCPEQLWPVTL